MSYPPPNDPYPASPYSQPYNYPPPSQPQPQQQPQQPSYPSQQYYPPQPQPQMGYPYGPAIMVAAPPSNGLAVASMVLGIIGLVFALLWGIGVLGSLLAVIFGHIALGQIKQSNGTQGGHGMAVAGLVMGYIVVGIVGLCVGVALFLGVGIGFTSLFVHATPTPIPFPTQ